MNRERHEITIGYPRESDVRHWEYRNARGEVPGRWPYGLDGFIRYADTVRVAEYDPPPVVPRLARRLGVGGRLRTGTCRADQSGRRVLFTWDEHLAHRAAAFRPANDRFTGVIWLTDRMKGRLDRFDRSLLRTLRENSGLFVLSRPQVDLLSDAVGQDGPPVSFVRFGVDAQFFGYASYPEKPLVLSVGGDRDRDPGTLFAALADVRARFPAAEILVQSSSNLTPPVGVTLVRHFTHAELRAAYSRASAVVIATRSNLHASGMTVSLEAMATGRPVVITDSPGMSDYVMNGESGFTVRSGDASALSEAVVGLLHEPSAAAAMGRAARRLVEDRFTTSHMVSAMARMMGLEDQ